MQSERLSPDSTKDAIRFSPARSLPPNTYSITGLVLSVIGLVLVVAVFGSTLGGTW